MTGAARSAVFLDRDGTLVEDPGYLRDAESVRLLPGAAEALGRLQRGGLLLVVVTNQSGIARGKLTREEYDGVAARLEELLAALGVRLDATYVCPHAPELDGPCPCRKPAPGLFRQAARELGIDLARSWWLGDRMSDVAPAAALGGRGILLLSGEGRAHEVEARAAGIAVAAGLPEAAAAVLEAMAGG